LLSRFCASDLDGWDLGARRQPRGRTPWAEFGCRLGVPAAFWLEPGRCLPGTWHRVLRSGRFFLFLLRSLWCCMPAGSLLRRLVVVRGHTQGRPLAKTLIYGGISRQTDRCRRPGEVPTLPGRLLSLERACGALLTRRRKERSGNLASCQGIKAADREFRLGFARTLDSLLDAARPWPDCAPDLIQRGALIPPRVELDPSKRPGALPLDPAGGRASRPPSIRWC
jgi:hypothetical protein